MPLLGERQHSSIGCSGDERLPHMRDRRRGHVDERVDARVGRTVENEAGSFDVDSLEFTIFDSMLTRPF